jgi:HK97 family phage major capsid protein
MNLKMAMLASQLALMGKIAAAGASYEKREEPSLKAIADSIDRINTTFTEYRATNDARLKAVEEGKSTSDFDAKLAKMDETLNGLAEQKSQLEKLQTRLSRPGLGATGRDERTSPEAEAYKTAFLDWVRNPSDPERRTALQQRSKEMRRQQGDDGWETRASQAVTSSGAAGGFGLPEVIESAINRVGLDVSPIRQIAHVVTTSSPDYKELIDVNGSGFEWLGETDTRNQTNTPDLAEVAPTFGLASAKPQASEESLDDLFFNVEDWLVSGAGDAIGQGEGAAFISGNGTKKPTGFLAGTPVATADASRAFGVLQYIASGQAAAMPSSLDTLYDLVYSLRARYRANAKWVAAKLSVAALRKYKDSSGQYLWQPALAAGQPDAFMGYEMVEAEDMPAVAANALPLAFGDFKEGYVIADRVGMRITRDEITTPGFVKFYVRKRVGGKIRNSQAIKLLKIAAS